MATAKAGPRKTSRTVTLKLTEGEADTLLGLMANVGGDPTRSPRKYVKRMQKALEGALGYGADETDAQHLSLGHIEMFDYDRHPEITVGDRLLGILTSVGFQLHAEFDPRLADAIPALEEFASTLHGVDLSDLSS